MRCQRCWKKMRLKKDGWKRCGKCGTQVMGLALRISTLGLHLVEAAESPIDTAIPQTNFQRRLPVTWKAST